MTEFKPPIRTLQGISDDDVLKTIQSLADEGYMIHQKKRHERQDGKKLQVTWDIKAKLNEPPIKKGRELVE